MEKPLPSATTTEPRFRFYDLVMAAFVTVLLLSNIIGAAKLSAIPVGFWPEGWWPAPEGMFIFGAGILFFPVSYVIGDVLTEVYGYARARRVIWTGFAAMVFMALMSWAVVAMPPADGWDGQEAYKSVFGLVPRIVLASIIAFWAGEFVNSYVLARMKIWTGGKALWSRTIGSTVVGQAVDSAIFYPVAFLGIWETSAVLTVMVTNWALKVLWEAVLTPVTYVVVGRLKQAEGVEIFDTDTDFSPFANSDTRA
ncbi:queuosine precursor transporter [Qipengyuania sp. 1NDH17]|uniref:Probable queuosine precursor transporter n=1 Tax=Qipengyuania polymorpha TaxID=2867234 RepID=A0ABS7J1M9_9SPHN|nr:queuosine precursor transporter [Qipengyuania polymorpha]MBX7459254.1 queuosine precursor transporter [Qipengyuania polymorpha]